MAFNSAAKAEATEAVGSFWSFESRTIIGVRPVLAELPCLTNSYSNSVPDAVTTVRVLPGEMSVPVPLVAEFDKSCNLDVLLSNTRSLEASLTSTCKTSKPVSLVIFARYFGVVSNTAARFRPQIVSGSRSSRTSELTSILPHALMRVFEVIFASESFVYCPKTTDPDAPYSATGFDIKTLPELDLLSSCSTSR